MFYPPTRIFVYPIIPEDATSIVCYRSNTVHKSLWHNFKLQKAAKCGCHAFIIYASEYTWNRELRNYETTYSNITTKALMDHLQLHCSGLHTLDVVVITSNMLTYYGDSAGIPEYINMIEDAQKKPQRTKLPIPDITLVDIATKLILQAQLFTLDIKE